MFKNLLALLQLDFFSAYDSSIQTDVGVLDFSRAFDTVNHVILLRKIERYGVRGIALQLLSSYLKNRQQTVEIRGKVSSTRPLNISVPQGSVLGP